MSDKISLALIGVGNVTTTLVKGFEYYKNSTDGLWHPKVGGMTLNDFTITAVYDIDATKVGKNISSLVRGCKSDFGNLIVQPGIVDDVSPEHISKNGQITEAEIMELLGVKRTRAYTVAKQMCDENLIVAVGRGKNKKYLPVK